MLPLWLFPLTFAQATVWNAAFCAPRFSIITATKGVFRRDSRHLPHPTWYSCPEGGSQFRESTAESWWSEVTILGHGVNGSNKNRLHSDHLLLRRAERARERERESERGREGLLYGVLWHYYTLRAVCRVYCTFRSPTVCFIQSSAKGTLHSISHLSRKCYELKRYFSRETELFIHQLEAPVHL